ncbi:FMN-binding protein [Streptomyces sp. NPDC052236]|uniref:FMN-binding protein n=1 Tax=Streptomyces sp. NPDC052236 TaxID=3365686 RepID=UPI0037D97544
MKRKHPLRRIMIGAAATVSGVVLLLALKMPMSEISGSSSVQAGGALPPAAAAGAQTVLGDVAKTQYGEVQVRLTLGGGRITAAEAVKAPNSEARSQQISADAIPKLNAAAVAAQSAQLDAVSGASYTSKGYLESLQSALDKAGVGGGGGAGAGDVEAGGAATPPPVAAPEPEPEPVVTQPPPPVEEEAEAEPEADGGNQTVLGDVADTQYGPVQVQITLSGGKITAAEAVKTPNSDANSRSIAANAVPQLNQAAVAAQSAQLDAVSGASYTSQGYMESLQSALDKAGV